MTRALSVRQATLDDLPTIVALRLALLREYGDHPMYARLRNDVGARALDLYRSQLLSPIETLMLAELGGDAVGILRCVDIAASPLLLPERYCYISSVYVVPAQRKRGVLRALMRAAEDWCADRGLTEMRLHNSASNAVARDAWQALGFDIVEEVRRRVLPVPVAARDESRHHAEAR